MKASSLLDMLQRLSARLRSAYSKIRRAHPAILTFGAFFACGLLLIGVRFLAYPYSVSGEALPIFPKGGFVLTEEFSFRYGKPQVGQAVIFRPNGSVQEYLGLIVGERQDADENLYEAYSTLSAPWQIREEEITKRIYFPFVSRAVRANLIDSILVQSSNRQEDGFGPSDLSSSPPPSPTRIPTTPTPPSSTTAAMKTPTSTVVPTLTPTRAPTRGLTNTPWPTLLPTGQPTPTPFTDSDPPVVTIMSGPPEGSSIDSASFCFPLMVTDYISKYPKIEVRTRFDSAVWTSWGTDVAPCYQNVASGAHAFLVQARDEAGNVSAEVGRNFNVLTP